MLWFVIFQVSRNAKLYLERAVSASSLSLACNSILVSPEGSRLLAVSSDKAKGLVQLLIE